MIPLRPAGRTAGAGVAAGAARRITAAMVSLGVAGCALAGCAGTTAAGSAAGSTAAGSAAGSAAQLSGTLTVFAAASLKATFTTLGREFETEHPGSKIALSFAGSSDLATQIQQGAPADVFASADEANMARLGSAGLLAGPPQDFASNVLTIAVPPANPAGITSFADLAQRGVKVVVCARQVPCGAAAQKIQDTTGIRLSPVSEESSVTDVLGKVVSGEADAGLVYATDVKGAGGRVRGIPFESSSKAVNTYPIATVRDTRQQELATAFLALVTGPEGRKVLANAGFGTP